MEVGKSGEEELSRRERAQCGSARDEKESQPSERSAHSPSSSSCALGCPSPLHSTSTLASSLTLFILNSPRQLADSVMVDEMVLSRSETVRNVVSGGRRMLTCGRKSGKGVSGRKARRRQVTHIRRWTQRFFHTLDLGERFDFDANVLGDFEHPAGASLLVPARAESAQHDGHSTRFQHIGMCHLRRL